MTQALKISSPQRQVVEDRSASSPSIDAGFDDLETAVLAVAEHDDLSTIRDPAHWRSRAARLLGGRAGNRLANHRLEELRRFAVLCNGGRDPGDDALDRFLDAGFSLEQAHFVQRYRSGPRRPPLWSAESVVWVSIALLSFVVYLAMERLVGEEEVSMIGAGLVFVTLLSLGAQRGQAHRRS